MENEIDNFTIDTSKLGTIQEIDSSTPNSVRENFEGGGR